LRGGEKMIVACVAQLVEHVLGKDEVTGSIPVASSREFDIREMNDRRSDRERYYHIRVFDMQKTQLLDDQKQEEANGKS
jgi:hypothetical protein